MATEKFLDILSDQSNTNFKATTCALAKLKFNRLLKKHPGHSEYGDVLLKSAKDLESDVEYDKYLIWLSNPRKVTGDRNPDPSCTGEFIPKSVLQPEFLKSSGNTVVIDREQIKNIPNAVFIHMRQTQSDETEEKVFES